MELTYDSSTLRKIATDQNSARKKLGDELADALLSLVADMRNAMYLGEIPEPPKVVEGDPLVLQYPLGPGCVLEVQPLGLVDPNSWSAVHRLKLVRVAKEGMQLI